MAAARPGREDHRDHAGGEPPTRLRLSRVLIGAQDKPAERRTTLAVTTNFLPGRRADFRASSGVGLITGTVTFRDDLDLDGETEDSRPLKFVTIAPVQL